MLNSAQFLNEGRNPMANAHVPGRGRIYQSITETIGDRPLVQLNRLAKAKNVKALQRSSIIGLVVGRDADHWTSPFNRQIDVNNGRGQRGMIVGKLGNQFRGALEEEDAACIVQEPLVTVLFSKAQGRQDHIVV